MKQYFSILTIAARSTIYKIIGLFVLMAALEMGVFYHLLQQTPAGEMLALEVLISQSRIPLICGAFFLLLCVILSLVGYEYLGSKTRYSILRFSPREEVIVLLWALYHMICFLIFWAIQLLVALMLCHLYISVTKAEYWNEQTIFLAFYRSNFLHSLLPLEEISRWMRNVALIVALGITAAGFSLKQRREQKGMAIAVLAVMTVATFSQQMGNLGSDVILILIALSVAGFSVYDIWWGQKNEE